MRGRYCSACGQEDTPPLPSLKSLAGEVVEEFAKLEARVPQTLLSLFLRPGELTVAYAKGQRARFVSPMKLNFMSSFVFYLLMDVFNGKDMSSFGAKLPEDSSTPITQAITQGARFFQENSATFSIVLLPLSAVGLVYLFRGRKQPLILHLVTTLHAWAGSVAYFSILYLAIKAAERWFEGPDPATLFGTIYAALIVAYQVPCFRRVYGVGWIEAVFKSILASAWAFFLSMICMLLVIAAILFVHR